MAVYHKLSQALVFNGRVSNYDNIPESRCPVAVWRVPRLGVLQVPKL